jgi:predicted AAA+ superfamily ATPase
MYLSEVAEYWSFWNKPIPKTVTRMVKLPSLLDSKLVLAIQGVRRSGKSTLLLQIIKKQKLDPKNCLIVNFEDPRLANDLNAKTLDNLVSFFRDLRGPDANLYFFFDEIQNVENWHKWIHTQLERSKNNYYIVTGSNASMLSRELGSKLTGRHVSVTLFPFSYEERKEIEKNLSVEEYLKKGGFPGTFNYPEPDELLRQYYDDIIEKDILSRIGITNPRALRQLVKILFESSGSESSFRKLAGSVGLSNDTASSYVSYCENAYLIFSCPYFSFSEKQRVRRNNKYYPVDSALRRASITKSGFDIGKDFELMFFLALKRRFKDVYYWKGKSEVDFVVQNSRGIWPLQVSIEAPKDRHSLALEEFYSNFSMANKEHFVNPDNFMEVIEEIS